MKQLNGFAPQRLTKIGTIGVHQAETRYCLIKARLSIQKVRISDLRRDEAKAVCSSVQLHEPDTLHQETRVAISAQHINSVIRLSSYSRMII